MTDGFIEFDLYTTWELSQSAGARILAGLYLCAKFGCSNPDWVGGVGGERKTDRQTDMVW